MVRPPKVGGTLPHTHACVECGLDWDCPKIDCRNGMESLCPDCKVVYGLEEVVVEDPEGEKDE